VNVSVDLHGGRIWTGAPQRPWATSLSIRDGRVTALDVTGSPGIDLGDLVAVPGLIDTHVHLVQAAEALGDLDLSSVTSRPEFEASIARAHASLPEGRWLVARGWSNERWPGGELPDKTWLAAAGDRPVVCHRVDLHATLVNDAVLARCDTSTSPPGGRIHRDAAGMPTGLMVEQAAWRLINPLVPDSTVEQRRDAVRRAQAHLATLGVTTAATMEYTRTVEQVLEPLRGELRVRCPVILLDRPWPLDVDAARRFAADDRLAVIGFKAFIDGTLGSRTARMLTDYADDPGNRGLLVELAADGHLDAWVRLVAGAGLIPCMHAIGDEAVRLALDALAGVTAVRRIEHAQHVDPADVRRFEGVVASMQPQHRVDDWTYVERRLGAARMRGAFALRDLAEAGAVLAFGSDWPVVTADPIAGMRAAITGHGQTIDVEQALRAYTTGAAHACRLDAGVLRPGALGDVTVLDRDPFSCDWHASPPNVLMTIVGGQVVYDRR